MMRIVFLGLPAKRYASFDNLMNLDGGAALATAAPLELSMLAAPAPALQTKRLRRNYRHPTPHIDAEAGLERDCAAIAGLTPAAWKQVDRLLTEQTCLDPRT